MNFTIRQAFAADVPAMHRLRNRVGENRLSDPQHISEATYLPYIAAGSSWIAETDDCVLGFGAIDACNATVWALFVDPQAEGCGIGRALHHQMINWAHEHGIGRLSLSTGKGTRAVEFYKRAGWTEVGTTADGEALFEKSPLR
jgi:GNAT superfamily N-acetyltransferase